MTYPGVSPSSTNLAASWSFDDTSGSVATDSLGNITLTVAGGVTNNQPAVVPSDPGGLSFAFDGSTGYLDATIADTVLALDTLSAIFWIYRTANSGSGTILATNRMKFTTSPASNGSNVEAYIADGGQATSSPPGSAPINAVTQIAFTYNSGVLILYSNGVEVTRNDAAGAMAGSHTRIRIARDGISPGGGDDWYVGRIDGGRLWNRALTAQDIADDYSAGTNVTSSPRAVPATATLSGGNVAVSTLMAAQFNGRAPFDTAIPPGARICTAADRANLQTLLNANSVLFLKAGDYQSGGLSSLTIGSNQQLWGEPGERVTKVPNITIPAGTTHAVICGVASTTITFNNGAAISDVIIKQMMNAVIVSNGASINGCGFLSLANTNFLITNTGGGYFRNNRILRHKAQGRALIDWNGNGKTGTDYGNVFIYVNDIFSDGDTYRIQNVAEVTLLGLDVEAPNRLLQATLPARINYTNVGHVRLMASNGNQNGTPSNGKQNVVDIGADAYLHEMIAMEPGSGKVDVTYKAGQNVSVALESNHSLTSTDAASSPTRMLAYTSGSNTTVSGTDIATTTPSSGQQAALRTAYRIGESRPVVPWEAPSYDPPPDPAPANWATARATAPDSRATLQSAIDAGNLLPDGVFYIGSPLSMSMNCPTTPERSMIRSAGRTTIICKSDSIDAFHAVSSPTSKSFTMVGLCIYGGANGINFDKQFENQSSQWSDGFMVNVTFRNQANACINTFEIGGVDNNWFENVNFLNSPAGIKQRTNYTPGQFPDPDLQAYWDKDIFFHCQWRNCGLGWDGLGKRANVLLTWVNSLFKDCTTRAYDTGVGEAPLFVNCDLDNCAGDPVIRNTSSKPATLLVSCRFLSGGGGGRTMLQDHAVAEGCSFERTGGNGDATITGSSRRANLENCVSASMPLGSIGSGILVNNRFQQSASANNQGVVVTGGSFRIFLTGAVTTDPTPQALVGAAVGVQLAPSTGTRTATATAALRSTPIRAVTATGALARRRDVTASVATLVTALRGVLATGAVQETLKRAVPASVSVVLSRLVTATVAFRTTATGRLVPATLAAQLTAIRAVLASASTALNMRLVPAEAALSVTTYAPIEGTVIRRPRLGGTVVAVPRVTGSVKVGGT